jgi:hypothetical protein
MIHFPVIQESPLKSAAWVRQVRHIVAHIVADGQVADLELKDEQVLGKSKIEEVKNFCRLSRGSQSGAGSCVGVDWFWIGSD